MDENNTIGFFNEDKESRSMMRLMCFLSFFVAIGFAIAAVWLATNILFALSAQYAMIFAFGFIGTAFGGKLFQKMMEKDIIK